MNNEIDEQDYRHSYGWQKTENETADKIIFANDE